MRFQVSPFEEMASRAKVIWPTRTAFRPPSARWNMDRNSLIICNRTSTITNALAPLSAALHSPPRHAKYSRANTWLTGHRVIGWRTSKFTTSLRWARWNCEPKIQLEAIKIQSARVTYKIASKAIKKNWKFSRLHLPRIDCQSIFGLLRPLFAAAVLEFFSTSMGQKKNSRAETNCTNVLYVLQCGRHAQGLYECPCAQPQSSSGSALYKCTHKRPLLRSVPTRCSRCHFFFSFFANTCE